MNPFSESRVTCHQFGGQSFYLKRDDELHPQFSGNKARKLMALLTQPAEHTQTLIGYGSAQANSLYSFAALAALKHWQLEFYVHHIPDWLKQSPLGNYRAALELGANIIDVSASDHPTLSPADYIHQVRQPGAECLVVPEGGRSPLAKSGVETLAQELKQFIQQHQLTQVAIALPSGTGTTAFYLHQYLDPYHIEVITTPCVGDHHYLIQQFHQLDPGATRLPTIWTLPQKHHFGKLYHSHYVLWQQLKAETGIEFELLYDPLMWLALQQHRSELTHKTLIYIHQGGLLGNESMLPRYQRKWPALAVPTNTEK